MTTMATVIRSQRSKWSQNSAMLVGCSKLSWHDTMTVLCIHLSQYHHFLSLWLASFHIFLYIYSICESQLENEMWASVEIWFLRLFDFSVAIWINYTSSACLNGCVAANDNMSSFVANRMRNEKVRNKRNRFAYEWPNAEPIPAELTCQLHKFRYHRESNVNYKH